MAGKTNRALIWIGLVAGLLLLAEVNVCCGSILLTPFGNWSPIEEQIVWQLRLPKMLTAILAGMALSVSGMLMQTLFRNPLAGPYILGVSSGAGLGVAIVTLAGVQLTLGIAGSAIIGSTAVLMLILAVSRKVRDNINLLIVGMMCGAIAGALVNMLQNISNPDALKMFIVWTLGSLSNVGWNQLAVLSAIVALGTLIAVGLIKPLNGLILGETNARGLGINVEHIRTWIVIATALLAGGVTAFCGPIAFVGVAVPHIARGIMRTNDHRQIMPATALIGANLLLICDILCSISTYPLPISTMSALFGAPIIIWIIVRNKDR
ncbi:MAG: iron ABC transporter permease [Paludibacteraceae bacterium]|nr:iron ABC transporter permease [Paludibacteraceae bacterium]